MSFFASPSTLGLYSTAIHGARVLLVPDLAWVSTGPGATRPLIELPNPLCTVPADAVPITQALRDELREAFDQGKVMGWSDDLPVAVDPPPLAPERRLAFLKVGARHRLQKKDHVVSRCAERNIPVPAAWANYADELRLIDDIEEWNDSLGLPEEPAYPEGT